MMLSLSVTDFIIISLAVQGVIAAAVLAYSSKKIKSNRWLAAFIFVVSYLAITMEVFKSGAANTHPWLWVELPQIRMLLGPLAFFYTRSLLYGKNKLVSKDYFHFSALQLEIGPQILYALHASGLFLSPAIQKLYYWKLVQVYFFGGNYFENLPAFISLVIYSALCCKMVYQNRNNRQLSAHKVTDVKWLKNLLYLLFAMTAVWLMGIIGGIFPKVMELWNFYILYIPIVMAIYWLAVAAYVRQSKMETAEIFAYNKPPVRIYYKDVQANEHHQQLIFMMEYDKAYLNPQLKLDIVAERLKVSEKLVSSLLNQYVGKNFNDFTNQYRVNEAKIRLTDPAYKQFTIAAIAYDCGFNSLATFQRCFKQFTGVTPSQYQTGLQQQIL